jgi:hypothetical protein
VSVDDRADWLDGNALAGVLEELLGAELTAAPRACHRCGGVHPVGAHRLHRGAGLVLRCPQCGDVALRLALAGDRRILELRGTWTLDVPATS